LSYQIEKKLYLPCQASKANPKALGDWSENFACKWLKSQGLTIIDRNFHSKYGEIDLIMKADDCLIFIEVRYRKNTDFGSAEASITDKKCQRLTATAQYYLLKKKYGINTAIRFDAIAISPSKESDLHCTLNWIKNILS